MQLFEFEDYAWFPNFLRKCMTRFIVLMHRFTGTADDISQLLTKGLQYAQEPHILDMCSGSGGPMKDVFLKLKTQEGLEQVRVTLSDLYPNKEAAAAIKAMNIDGFDYLTEPVNATKVPEHKGMRTMICSMHHMTPATATSILKDAKDARQPFCFFELSDNSFPKWLWWIAFPINVIMVVLLTPFIRPMTWQQLVFTYLIPVLPFLTAWDGAVSNARTYTMDDIDVLIKDLKSDDYMWEKGIVKTKGAPKSYLLGYPV